MTCNRNECKGETDTANTLMARDYKGIGNQDATAVAIKVKEATKQGYANALVGGGRLHQSVHAREQDQKGESG